MTKFEFKKWVKEMYKKAAIEGSHNACDIVARSNVTVCVDSNGRIGIAKCHPDDIFDYGIGTAIAYARCKGIEVPKVTIYKKLSEMKNGENFVGVFGDTYRYVAKDKSDFVVWNYEDKNYQAMPFDVEYEMVD